MEVEMERLKEKVTIRISAFPRTARRPVGKGRGRSLVAKEAGRERQA